MAAIAMAGNWVSARLAGPTSEEMVLSGHAVSYGLYRDEEETARTGRLGLWGGDFVRPQEWRRSNGGAEEAPHRAGDWLEIIIQWLQEHSSAIMARIGGD